MTDEQLAATVDQALAVEQWPITHVRPAEDNPRDTLGELGELTDSIEASGIWQPLIVQPTGEMGDGDIEVVMIVAGHRRHAAAQLAELTHIPVIIRGDIDEHGRQAAFFEENFHRLDLSPIERARALQQLADSGVPQKEIGKRVGIAQGTVSKWLTLLKLPEKAQKWVVEGELPQEEAVTLASLPAAKVQELTEHGLPAPWRITEAKRAVEREKDREKATKEVAKKGWKVLEADPAANQQLEIEGNHDPVALDSDRHDPAGLLRHVEPEEHESEPCHAAYVTEHGEIISACTDPERHLPAPEGWKSPADIEREELAERKPAKPAAPGGPFESAADKDRRRRSEADARIASLVGLAKAAIGKAAFDNPAVMDYGARGAMIDEELDWGLIGSLLDIEASAFAGVNPILEAMADGSNWVDGFNVIHAWGLGVGLCAARAIAAKPDAIAKSDAEAVTDLLAHLALFDEAPDFETWLASLSDESNEAPTVSVYLLKGKYRRRCSECGELDGQNTKEELARGRNVLHLKEQHGIEPAEEAAAS